MRDVESSGAGRSGRRSWDDRGGGGGGAGGESGRGGEFGLGRGFEMDFLIGERLCETVGERELWSADGPESGMPPSIARTHLARWRGRSLHTSGPRVLFPLDPARSSRAPSSCLSHRTLAFDIASHGWLPRCRRRRVPPDLVPDLAQPDAGGDAVADPVKGDNVLVRELLLENGAVEDREGRGRGGWTGGWVGREEDVGRRGEGRGERGRVLLEREDETAQT